MQIRETNLKDSSKVKEVYLQAFDPSESEIVSNLAVNLIQEDFSVNILSLVVTDQEEIIGHIAFSPVYLNSTDQPFGYILAPLAILPQYQKKKIGSTLVKEGLKIITSKGAFIIFVYGDPQYYSRFGFSHDLAHNYQPPYYLKYPEGWQVLNLNSPNFPEKGLVKCVNLLHDPILW